jgi:flagellar motor switch protein FliM
MLKGMEDAWQPLLSISGRYLGSEMNPYLLGASAVADVMVMGTFNVEMSAQISGEIIFAIPLSALEEVRDRLKSSFLLEQDGEDTSEAAKRLREHLFDTELEARAIIDTVDLSVRELIHLQAGDFISLNKRAMDQVVLKVEGKPLFVGRGAQHQGTSVFVVSRRSE